MKARSLVCVFALAAVSFGAQKSAQLWYGIFGPEDELRASNPRLTLQVWVEGGPQVKGGSFKLNGKEIPASYDASTRELWAELKEPLAPGTYNVESKTTTENRKNFFKKWSFKVASNAVELKNSIPAESKAGLDEYNKIRREHGLAPYTFDPGLNEAAVAHSNYLFLNKDGGHTEVAGKPGFLAPEPEDRVKLFGHVGVSFEAVSSDRRTAEAGLRELWDSTYHRIILMQPGPGRAGVGFKGTYFTINGVGSDTDGIFTSPPNNGKDVPLSWTNREIPSPLRKFPEANASSGYPIVVSVYGKDITRVGVDQAKLSTSQGTVDCYVLEPINDEYLKTSVILVPKQPLKPATQYSVSVRLKDAKGGTHNKDWRFTTK